MDASARWRVLPSCEHNRVAFIAVGKRMHGSAAGKPTDVQGQLCCPCASPDPVGPHQRRWSLDETNWVLQHAGMLAAFMLAVHQHDESTVCSHPVSRWRPPCGRHAGTPQGFLRPGCGQPARWAGCLHDGLLVVEHDLRQIESSSVRTRY